MPRTRKIGLLGWSPVLPKMFPGPLVMPTMKVRKGCEVVCILICSLQPAGFAFVETDCRPKPDRRQSKRAQILLFLFRPVRT